MPFNTGGEAKQMERSVESRRLATTNGDIDKDEMINDELQFN